MSHHRRALAIIFPVLAFSLNPTAFAQEKERKPGWEKEQEILKKTGQLPKEDKPGLAGKEAMSKFEQVLLERLRLTSQQQARIHDILLAHASEMVAGAANKKSFTDEHGKEYKELKKQAEEAKKSGDKEQLRSIMERLSALRKDQLSAKSQASADYSSLISDVEKELTKAQVEEFLKIVEELGMSTDEDVGAKLLPKEFVHIITSESVGLSDEQRREVSNIYRQTQEDARKLEGDKSKLPPILDKMRADIRAVLEPSQRRIAAQLLLKAEGRTASKQAPAKPGVEGGEPTEDDAASPGAPDFGKARKFKKKAKPSADAKPDDTPPEASEDGR